MLFLRLSFNILFFREQRTEWSLCSLKDLGITARRDPVFLEKLSNDQIDIIHRHLEEFGKGTVSFGVQTYHVIIISTDIEMIYLVNSRRQETADKTTDTNALEKCDSHKKT